MASKFQKREAVKMRRLNIRVVITGKVIVYKFDDENELTSIENVTDAKTWVLSD